ncbi:MAG: hypothetical protein WD403_00795, partial [Pirellulales bacterium]
PYEAGDKALAAVSSSFFDWNEVRVSTVKELAEVMHILPDPAVAANNLKRVLQGVFESTYSFDLESLKKQNLGQAAQRLKKFEGTTPFAINYVTQATLGGHAIPVDRGLFGVFKVLGLAGDEDAGSGVVPGLERAIPKNKGVEFGSLAHQLGADFIANPYSPALHKVLLEIAPDAKERLPKRPTKAARAAASEAQAAGKAKAAAKKKAEPGKAKPPASGRAGERPAKADAGKTEPGKSEARDQAAKSEAAKAEAAGKPGKKAAEKRRSAAVGLSKRKPR